MTCQACYKYSAYGVSIGGSIIYCPSCFRENVHFALRQLRKRMGKDTDKEEPPHEA